MKKIGSLLALWFVYVFCLAAMAQDKVQVEVALDRTQVELGDSFVLELKVKSEGNANVEEPELPPMNDFTLLGRSTSTSQQVSFVNGKIASVRELIYQFELKPNKKGDLAIPPISVVANGNTLRSDSKRIQVMDPGTLPPQAQSPQRRSFPGLDSLEDELFESLLRRRNPTPKQPIPSVNIPDLNPNEAFQVRVEVDKDEVFEGEQVTANYYIYVPEKYILRGIDTIKYPNLQGFWKEDIEISTVLNYEAQVINGVTYRRALLASYALFPIKEGSVYLDEYKAKCDVSTQSVFGLGQVRSYTKSSKRKKIQVKALPLANKPSNFTGAVGDFKISASIESKQITQHQPFALKLKIEGKGNAKTIELPNLNLPPSVELYDTQQDSKFFKDGRSEKTFQVYLIPRESGKLGLPDIRFSIFDPQTETYKEIRSGAIELDVLAGQGPDLKPVVQGSEKPLAKEKDPVNTLGFLYEEELEPSFWVRHGMNLFLFLLCFTILHSFYFGFRELSKRSDEKKIQSIYQERWKNIKKQYSAGDFRTLGVEVSNLVYVILGACLEGVETGEDLESVLSKLNPKLREEVGPEIQEAFGIFQALAFAPESALGAWKDKKKIKQHLDRLDIALKVLIKKYERT